MTISQLHNFVIEKDADLKAAEYKKCDNQMHNKNHRYDYWCVELDIDYIIVVETNSKHGNRFNHTWNMTREN